MHKGEILVIPKVIHYCWFGRKPLPSLALKCIGSWKKFLPDYEIKEWNENNFDIKQIPYTEQAYRNKKYAFVSDYARFKILYEYGGIYFDTDVELIKPIDDILRNGAYMGLEIDIKNAHEEDLKSCINPGLGFAVPPKHPFIKRMLDKYKSTPFENNNSSGKIKTITHYTSQEFFSNGWIPKEGAIDNVQGINIYPRTFFCPFSRKTFSIEITEDTRSIHHYTSSWITRRQLWINKHRYLCLLVWLLKRPLKDNIIGLYRVIKERSIWGK